MNRKWVSILLLFQQPSRVRVVEWRTEGLEGADSDPWLAFSFLHTNPCSLTGIGKDCHALTYSLNNKFVEKKISVDRVFDLAVEQQQLFRNSTKTKWTIRPNKAIHTGVRKYEPIVITISYMTILISKHRVCLRRCHSHIQYAVDRFSHFFIVYGSNVRLQHSIHMTFKNKKSWMKEPNMYRAMWNTNSNR